MPCNSARADVLRKGKLNAFVHFWNSGEHVWYLFVFILDWMYSLLFKVNFLKPHCFSVILFLLFPTTHIWSLNRFLAFPPPIFGLQLVTIGKQRVCMVLHVPNVSLLQQCSQQDLTGGNKALTADTTHHPWMPNPYPHRLSSSFQLVFPVSQPEIKAISILCSLLTLQKAWQVLCLLQEQAQKQSSSVSLPASLCTAEPFHWVLRFYSSCQHETVLVPVQFKWNISLRDQQQAHGNDSDH